MDLRHCGHLHYIQAIKGSLVTKVLNVARGKPKILFKDVIDIYDGFLSHNDDVKAERSCFGDFEERTVKTEPDALVCNANDGGDHQIKDDDDFDDFTLKQIKENLKTRKRKPSQGLESSKIKIKIEDSSSLEGYGEEKMTAEDSDLMETLSSWKSKVSNNMKAKKKGCLKDPISIPTYTQDIMPVVKFEEIQSGQELPFSSEEIQSSQEITPSNEEIQNYQEFPPSNEEVQNGQEIPPANEEVQNSQQFPPSHEEVQNGQQFPPSSEEIQNSQEIPSSSGDSAALIEVKSEVPETNFFGGFDDYSVIESKELGITYEWNLENELKYQWEERVDLIPLRMVRPSSMDIVIYNSQVSNEQSPNFPAIEFESEECIVHPDLHYIYPQVISLVEDHNSRIDDNQSDDDNETPVSLPNVAIHRNLDCVGLEFKDDKTFLGDSSKYEHKASAEDQVKPSSTIEHSSNPDGCMVSHSDDPPEYQKQSFASIHVDEKRHGNDATDEFAPWDEHNGSSKLHRPERLLSTRKAISPSSQERLCKALESVDLNYKNNLKCKGKLNFTEKICKKNGRVEGHGITGARFSDNPNKISVIPRTFKRVSHPKGISKISHSSRSATRLGCSSVQSCSKSAIAFTQQQMQDAESLAMRLTKELKSMKDIVDDMLRSEFCLNTPLRHKVNEARMAVKNATKAEEAAKRCVSFMARDCSRFCKIMKLADDGPPPQDVVRKERKKIAFADEAGGRLCQIKVYEDDVVSLSESN